MRNLALEIDNGSGYQWAWLGDDASVTVENVNPVFDTSAGGTFTHSISLDVARNSHIFGAAADFRGPKIFNLLRKKKARLWIMGYPVTGIIQLDSELSVEDGQVEIEIASNSKELTDLLEGVNCQDVDISDDNIMLGYALPEYLDTTIKSISNGNLLATYSHKDALPKVLFPKLPEISLGGSATIPASDYTNVQYPYSGASYDRASKATYPYCEARACYQKYVNSGDSWEKKRGYMHREPDAINSAPCFYVGYWFKKLWQNLGISVADNYLEKISDFNRLAFFHFDPHYDWGESTLVDYLSMSEDEQRSNKFMMDCSMSVSGTTLIFSSKSKHRFEYTYTAFLCTAIANSKNFPDTDAQNVIDSMQAAFGARFLYNSSMASLSVVLVRDILRQGATLELPCIVTKADKTEPGTQGFRLKYEGSSEAEYNGITKVDDLTGANEQYDADTTYNYTDWTNVIFITESGSFPSGITNQARSVDIPNYISLACHVTNSDKTCYVSCTTGNAYRIKVDSDAEDESTLYPSLFQVGTFQDWTEGDCSHEASDDSLIEEVSIPFTPVIPNDINIDTEKNIHIKNLTTGLTQKYAQLLDGEIHNTDVDSTGEMHTESYTYENLILATSSVSSETLVSGTLVLNITAVETYDISEDGPYYSYTNDTIALGVMRGSGSDASLDYYDSDYDGEDGEKWAATAGTDAEFTPDSIDEYGQSFDYNGSSTIVRSTGALKAGAEGYITEWCVKVGDTVQSGGNIAAITYTAGGIGYITADSVCTIENFLVSGAAPHVYEDTPVATVTRYVKATADNGLGYEYDSDYNFPLSLKLRAEKENPGYSEYAASAGLNGTYNGYTYSNSGTTVTLKNGTKVPNQRFFPINGTNAAGRGLGDRFYKEYAYWVLNRKILEMEVEASAAVLTGIDMTKRYRIGGVEGFIKQYSYSVSMQDGISDAKIELYYI